MTLISSKSSNTTLPRERGAVFTGSSSLASENASLRGDILPAVAYDLFIVSPPSSWFLYAPGCMRARLTDAVPSLEHDVLGTSFRLLGNCDELDSNERIGDVLFEVYVAALGRRAD